jgi:exodeoxyribonuclease V alpha subunit
VRLAVKAILSCTDFGCLWSGVNEVGQRVRIRSNEPVWPVPGEVYEVDGEEAVYRDQWGRSHLQIERAQLTRVRASGRLLLPWLHGLPGVGETRALRLLEAFGQDLLEVLDDPARLPDVARALEPTRPGLAARLAAAVQGAYVKLATNERDGVSEARFYAQLEELGVEERAGARSLWRLLGADAWERLSQRPYSTAAVLPWPQADHLGQRLLSAALGTKDVFRHPDRLAGACDSVVRDLLKEGNTAAAPSEFLRRLALKRVPAEEALRVGLERRKTLKFRDLLLAPGAAYLEGDLYNHLERLRAATTAWSLAAEHRARRAIEVAERETGLTLTEEQRIAASVLLQERVGLLQGGAGTGKTTSMRVLVAAWAKLHGPVEAAALSGKAALRLAQSTGMDVLTIAQVLQRLAERAELEAQGRIGPSDAGPVDERSNVKKRLPRFTPQTLLLIDEASMVDVSNLRRLLHYLPDGAGLLLVGDVAQLPPIGFGQVYHDLVRAGRGVAELTRPLRQAKGNPLLDVAAAIRAGHTPALPAFGGAAAGVQIVECSLMDVPLQLGAVRARLAREAAADEVFVLAARNSTVRAVCHAEMARRQAEGAEGVRLGPLCPWIAIGDPIIMAANHYKHGLANGQLGRVVSLDPITVLWDSEHAPRVVHEDYRADVLSAWAITCHKSQGSDAARVVVALDSKTMLTRQWLYTAVTRARTQAVLVGPREMIAQAVARVAERTTGFAELVADRPTARRSVSE